MRAQIILALDVPTLKEAVYFARRLYPQVKVFKIGMQLFTAYGPEAVRAIRKLGAEVFLDLKFHDIPNTVAQAVRQAVRLKVKMLTVHACGGKEMLQAASAAARDEAARTGVKKPLIVGVTVLTSQKATPGQVIKLARRGIENGLDGIVCSAREAKVLRKKIPGEFVIVTPGIRPRGTGSDDQKRTATCEEAVKAGSNFLVVGRPILKAKDPRTALKEF